ncbi:efflux RND transporter periplasmic adaptor subunit [Psychromonas aquimarina]|uniref:efflux RND transporter periplasmic adaptor subunit n=1 Tax=Psychromonas aquimarina TaxID=444919 RepID=UPI000407E4ED|nr:efflux RND transporter periplasmic adaptor subunit [Psychromonas aquimarina]
MKKWIASAILLAILVFGSVIGFNMFKASKIKEFLANRPVPEFPVTSATIQHEDWTPHLRAIGFIEPIQGVTVANEVAGKVVKINFESGQKLKADDALIYLDSEVEKANLKASQGRMPAVERNYKRMVSLFKKGSVSQGKVDEAEAELLTLQGQIEGYQATISRRIIRAPFDGIAGLRNVFMGEYLKDGSDIVRLEDVSRMRLRFTVPQNDLNKIHIGQKMNIFVDAEPEIPFTGTISAIEPAVNFQSGVIQVQADIPNEAQKLRSGMFAKANIILPTEKSQIIIPETAVNYTLYGETVYLLTEQTNEDGTSYMQADQQIVKLGNSKDGSVHVLDGLKKGDVIATSGQVRLSNGARVKIVESDILNKPAEIPAL